MRNWLQWIFTAICLSFSKRHLWHQINKWEGIDNELFFKLRFCSWSYIWFFLIYFSSYTKVLLSLERGVWAPNLHFNNPNPDIPALTDGRVQVVDRPTTIQRGIVGVNSFGFGGSNVHVILRPAEKSADVTAPPRMIPRMLQACGRTEAAVNTILQKGKENTADDNFLSLLNEVAGIPAASMPYRGYTLIGSQTDVTDVQQVQATGRPLWYICSGKSSNINNQTKQQISVLWRMGLQVKPINK